MKSSESLSMSASGMEKVSSLERMLTILDLFTEADPVWSVDEIAAQCGYTRSTGYRYMKELADAGLLAAAENARYSLGPRIIQLDRQLRVSDPMLKAMREIEATLPHWSPEQAWLLCRLFKDTVICIHETGNLPASLSFSRGFPMPLFRGATSKAILAFLPDHQQKRLYLHNERLIRGFSPGGTWKEYKASLREIRRQGYAHSVAEVDAGVFGIAAPVFSPDGKVIGSISNVRLVSRLDKAKWTQEGRLLTETARRISARIAALVGKTVLRA